jgi:hypothetical protein
MVLAKALVLKMLDQGACVRYGLCFSLIGFLRRGYSTNHQFFMQDELKNRELASVKGTMKQKLEATLKVSVAKTHITGTTFKLRLINVCTIPFIVWIF